MVKVLVGAWLVVVLGVSVGAVAVEGEAGVSTVASGHVASR